MATHEERLINSTADKIIAFTESDGVQIFDSGTIELTSTYKIVTSDQCQLFCKEDEVISMIRDHNIKNIHSIRKVGFETQ
jgi:hypothetical protein